MDQPIDLDSIDTVLATARSVRRNLDFERAVPAAVIHECIDLAAQAPTGAVNGESWRFLVVTEDRPKAALAAIYAEILIEFARDRGVELKPTHRALVERLPDIPAMIFICVDAPPPQQDVGAQVAFYGSVLPAAWSLMLALRARKIGATWTSLLASRQAGVRDVLGMPESSTHLVMLPVGYMKGARLKRAARLPAAEVTYWQRWGTPPIDLGP